MQIESLISKCLIKNDLTSTIFPDVATITQYIEEVGPHSLFICINNTKYDGHDFINEAILQGAAAIVVDHLPVDVNFGAFILVDDTNKALAQIAASFYDYPSRDITFIGVTGTNGKTTTTYLINKILTKSGLKSGLIGTMYNKIAKKILPTPNTTPHTVQLQKLIAEMAQENISHCVMEVSSHGLKQERVLGIDFNVAVFTNFTQDHLDFHPSMSDYFQAKSLLFTRLGNAFSDDIKAAVINSDDPYGRKLIPLCPANVLTYGCENGADVRASHITISPTETHFTLSLFDKEWPVTTKMIGLFNIYNCLAAFSTAIVLGFNPTDIITVLESVPGVRGRFEAVPNDQQITAIVDYAHTPDALINVLTTAKSLTKGRIYCVSGCGGDRDVTKRPKMAAAVTKYADLAIFTSDDPRTEDPAAIIEQMIYGLTQDNYIIEIDRKTAIEKALSLALPGDTVLITGKGHETKQMIGTHAIDFDDREVVLDFFKELHY